MFETFQKGVVDMFNMRNNIVKIIYSKFKYCTGNVQKRNNVRLKIASWLLTKAADQLSRKGVFLVPISPELFCGMTKSRLKIRSPKETLLELHFFAFAIFIIFDCACTQKLLELPWDEVSLFTGALVGHSHFGHHLKQMTPSANSTNST